MASSGTGRPLVADAMPSTIFVRSNGTRSPERFTTTSGTSSRRSKVVKRCPQARHSRRRRMLVPSSPWRESTTLSSRWEQAGHRTSATLPPAIVDAHDGPTEHRWSVGQAAEVEALAGDHRSTAGAPGQFVDQGTDVAGGLQTAGDGPQGVAGLD